MEEIRHDLPFDLKTAREITEDFSGTTGISCRLLRSDGRTVFFCQKENACARLAAAIHRDFRCAEQLHCASALQSIRFGGRYIYFCPMGMAFFASPIMNGGAFSGALVAGPVQIMDADDQLSASAVSLDDLSAQDAAAAWDAVALAPRRDSALLQSLSRQLFADAVYISDNSHMLLEAQDEHTRSSAIGSYIANLKSAEGDPAPYPIDKEQTLFDSVVRGDRETAGMLLNQLLGHIYFFSEDSEEARVRIAELFVVLTRASMKGGANAERALRLSRNYLRELRCLETQEELTRWLVSSLRQLMKPIFRTADGKHSEAMQKAMHYMDQRCALRLPLEKVAEYVGYSPAYFSHIFREETGMTFRQYLNVLRVEKSRQLLLSTELTVTEISAMTGFNDQSYFCKVFRKVAGVTPDTYRKRSRRIDHEKEYGRKV